MSIQEQIAQRVVELTEQRLNGDFESQSAIVNSLLNRAIDELTTAAVTLDAMERLMNPQAEPKHRFESFKPVLDGSVIHICPVYLADTRRENIMGELALHVKVGDEWKKVQGCEYGFINQDIIVVMDDNPDDVRLMSFNVYKNKDYIYD